MLELLEIIEKASANLKEKVMIFRKEHHKVLPFEVSEKFAELPEKLADIANMGKILVIISECIVKNPKMGDEFKKEFHQQNTDKKDD